jgi:uncharacterized protein
MFDHKDPKLLCSEICMCKILVLSDSHGSPSIIGTIVRQELPFDELLFCGDGIHDIESADLPKSFIINYVAGNIDRLHGKLADETALIETSGIRIFASHGDLFSVKNTLSIITREGTNRGADLVVFGHTHNPFFSNKSRPALLNPGSVKNGCYATIEIQKGKMKCVLKEFA